MAESTFRVKGTSLQMIEPISLVQCIDQRRCEPELMKIGFNSGFVLTDFEIQTFLKSALQVKVSCLAALLYDSLAGVCYRCKQTYRIHISDLRPLDISNILLPVVSCQLDRSFTKRRRCRRKLFKLIIRELREVKSY